MAQATKARTTKRNTPNNLTVGSEPRAAVRRNRPSPNTPARRKRQLTQRMKRFETGLAILPTKVKEWRGDWSRPRLAQIGFSGWSPSKVLSVLLLIGAISGIAWVHLDDRWFIYRENVQFENLHYLDAEQLYTESGIDGWNIFWLRPENIRQRLIALPYIVDAQVQTSLFSGIKVNVQEAQPVALWVTDQGTLWLLADGAALAVQTQNSKDIPQIVDGAQEAKALDTRKGLAIDPGILKSALAIKQQLPEIEQMRFNKDYGLNFHLPSSNAWVYWGDGTNIETKFTNLAAMQTLIKTGKKQPQIIDVRFERPYMN
ncbi:MAG: FtsQ-type POTRA domain-containing protein [Chloroflexi bacterium]|nr:FtsQ-type POTRA domain-containing protein [Chloroflexota bacterium]